MNEPRNHGDESRSRRSNEADDPARAYQTNPPPHVGAYTSPHRMDRREAIKWVLAASAAFSLLDLRSFGATGSGAGYGGDPDLMRYYRPGDLWPLTFTKEQRKTVAALCDVIIPDDDKSASASSVGVPDFVDEWISAPYPEQQGDRKQILEGLAWLDKE